MKQHYVPIFSRILYRLSCRRDKMGESAKDRRQDPAGVLSRRGAITANYEDFLTQYLTCASANPYHPVTNPEVGCAALLRWLRARQN